MICRECGFTNSKGVTNCIKCHASLSSSSITSTPSERSTVKMSSTDKSNLRQTTKITPQNTQPSNKAEDKQNVDPRKTQVSVNQSDHNQTLVNKRIPPQQTMIDKGIKDNTSNTKKHISQPTRVQASSTPANMSQKNQTRKSVPPLKTKRSEIIICSSCGHYPLKYTPSIEYPCNNCGYEGEKINSNKSNKEKTKMKKTEHNKKEVQKTIDIKDVFLEKNVKSKFSLKDINTEEVYTFTGDEHTIGRDDLDTSNMTISSSHINIVMEDGKWQLKDISSNNATFVQTNDKVTLSNGTKLIIGNKILVFEVND